MGLAGDKNSKIGMPVKVFPFYKLRKGSIP
jgi:hypothetical protein